MNLLLDSNAFVWAHEEPQKLSQKTATEIKNPANDLFLSAASVWELQIKIQIGKFNFKYTLENIIAEQQLINGLQILPVNLMHAIISEKSSASSQRPVRPTFNCAGDCRESDFGFRRPEVFDVSSKFVMVKLSRNDKKMV